MTTFNYTRPAELFAGNVGGRRGHPITYRRFATAADAIRYAIETLSPALLVATVIEIDEDRYDSKQIRAFYDSAEYPLTRRPGA